MKAIDFIYDERRLSDFGFMICSFDGGGVETVSDSEVTFNMVSALSGKRRYITDRVYESFIESTFQICKIPDRWNYNIEITFEEVRALKRWLERKNFCKVKFIQEPFSEFGYDFFFEGVFNVKQIEIGGVILGLELTLITNRPLALHDPINIKLEWSKNELSEYERSKKSITRTIEDLSDETGFCYPKMKVTCLENGSFQIASDVNGDITVVKNCIKNEVLTFEYPIVTSSIKTHDLANDFNFVFLKLQNSYGERENNFTIDSPCVIEIEYCPVVKIGV